MTRIAVIGAGMAGLTVARQLAEHADVTVFEKSPGYGGRMATRYAPPYEFDHGAQFFRAKSAEFHAELQRWAKAGVIAPWLGRHAELQRDRVISMREWTDEHPHFVAVPRMNTLGNYLATGIDVRLNTRVDGLARVSSGWQLTNESTGALGTFDWVISTAPAPQTAALLPEVFAHHAEVRKSPMSGCCAVMLGFEQPIELGWEAALVQNADISWISLNSSKPGRPNAFSMLVHSTNRYADSNLTGDHDRVLQHLLNEIEAITHIMRADIAFTSLHRWRYANAPRRKSAQPFFVDKVLNLAACGDWCAHGRVEAAFLSGSSLAAAIAMLVAHG